MNRRQFIAASAAATVVPIGAAPGLYEDVRKAAQMTIDLAKHWRWQAGKWMPVRMFGMKVGDKIKRLNRFEDGTEEVSYWTVTRGPMVEDDINYPGQKVWGIEVEGPDEPPCTTPE